MLEKYPAAAEETLLAALQQTWSDYKAQGHKPGKEASLEDASMTSQCFPDDALVTADNLVGGFGEGYGDMSEALACLQSELSESGNVAAIALADQLVLLPLGPTETSLPTPQMAWHQAQEWQACSKPLIAVDITVPELEVAGIESLARSWVAQDGAQAGGSLGGSHQLVALVCYMHHLQHYVAFCRRQSNSSRCCFFNDLPELTDGVPKEVEWSGVPGVCAQFSLTPRLALFESTASQ